MTVENGRSFQGWWLTKVFVDEMAQWLASLGGFLGHTAPDWKSPTLSPVLDNAMPAGMTNGGSGSNNESRYSSIDAEFDPNQSFISTTSNVGMPDANTSHEGKFAAVYSPWP
jgi:regulatory factor X